MGLSYRMATRPRMTSHTLRPAERWLKRPPVEPLPFAPPDVFLSNRAEQLPQMGGGRVGFTGGVHGNEEFVGLI